MAETIYTLVKKCSKCKVEKTLDLFYKNTSNKYGVMNKCKECHKEYVKKHQQNNPEKAAQYRKNWRERNLERAREMGRNWYNNNREYKNAKSREYERNRPGYAREQMAKWRERNREHDRNNRRTYENNRYKNDPSYKMKVTMRNNLYRTLLNETKENDVQSYLGYSPSQLRQRIEFNFEPGMSWENYGKWEVDHRLSITYLQKKGENRPHIINALSNLKPMWKNENRSKRAKHPLDFQS